MDESRRRDEADGQALLAGRQAEAEGDVALARAAVADGDDVLAPLDVVRARQLQHQHLVQRRQRQEVEAVEAFDRRELRRLDPALDHPPLAVDHLHLGQPHQVTRMVDALGGALPGDLVVLAQERRQLQRLQMVGEQDLRCVGHAATPARQIHVRPRRGRRDRCLGQIRIDRHVEAWRTPLDAAQHQMLHGIEADRAAGDGVAHGGGHVVDLEHLHQPQHLHELALALLAHPGFQKTPQRRELLGQLPIRPVAPPGRAR